VAGTAADYEAFGGGLDLRASNLAADLSTSEQDAIRLKIGTAISPAPFLDEVIPDSYAPSTTGNFKLKGSFFTENMTVTTTGGTVNYIIFHNDNDVDVNITTGATEGTFSVTIDNGISKTFDSVLLIILGTVFSPLTADWINIVGEPDLSKDGDMILTNAIVKSSATWDKVIDKTKNFRLYFSTLESPLVAKSSVGQGYTSSMEVFRMTDLITGDYYEVRSWLDTAYNDKAKFYVYKNNVNIGGPFWHPTGHFRIDYDGTYLYINNNASDVDVMGVIDTVTFVNNWQCNFSVRYYDNVNLKYVELI